MTDPRRQKRVMVVFIGENDKEVGTLFVAGQTWGAVEWSEKQGVWCIEDREGKCLKHASSIHGKAVAKDKAVALAERLVRNGELPSPEEARQLHREARERELKKRAARPSEIRRAQERAEGKRLSEAAFDCYWAEYTATPFYEIFAEALDLADPKLWQSNSFAMLRRLLVEVNAAVARRQCDLHRLLIWDRSCLARARDVLALLLDDGSAPS